MTTCVVITGWIGCTGNVEEVDTEEGNYEPAKERNRCDSVCSVETLEQDERRDKCRSRESDIVNRIHSVHEPNNTTSVIGTERRRRSHTRWSKTCPKLC